MLMRCLSTQTAFFTVKLTVVISVADSANLRVFSQHQTLYTDRVEWGCLFPFFMYHYLAKIIEDFSL